jgi:hypothetical protein
MANKLKQVLKPFRESWLLLIQSTLWIAAAIAAFVLPPPIGTGDETRIWVRFAQFVITIFIGLLVLLALRWKRKKHIFPWAGSAAGFLILGTLAFFSYQILGTRWTAKYNDGRVVVGSTLTQDGSAHLKENPSLTKDDLVWHAAGNAEKVWTGDSISERRFILAGIYVVTMPLFTICIISLLQAIQCATIEKPARRRPRAAPVSAPG